MHSLFISNISTAYESSDSCRHGVKGARSLVKSIDLTYKIVCLSLEYPEPMLQA